MDARFSHQTLVATKGCLCSRHLVKLRTQIIGFALSILFSPIRSIFQSIAESMSTSSKSSKQSLGTCENDCNCNCHKPSDCKLLTLPEAPSATHSTPAPLLSPPTIEEPAPLVTPPETPGFTLSIPGQTSQSPLSPTLPPPPPPSRASPEANISWEIQRPHSPRLFHQQLSDDGDSSSSESPTNSRRLQLRQLSRSPQSDLDGPGVLVTQADQLGCKDSGSSIAGPSAQTEPISKTDGRVRHHFRRTLTIDGEDQDIPQNGTFKGLQQRLQQIPGGWSLSQQYIAIEETSSSSSSSDESDAESSSSDEEASSADDSES